MTEDHAASPVATATAENAGDGRADGATGRLGPGGPSTRRAVRVPHGALRPYRPRRQGWRRWLPAACSALAVGAVIAVVLWQMQLPLLLSSTTTTGGDTGAHFMMPWILQHQLLPHFQLTGWSPSWYDGYPIYTFYFVFPDVLTALASASHLVSYDLAFKWSTVLGSLLLPVCAWAAGRLFSLRPPGPAALAVATLPFLFDYTFTIVGGNLFSTLAGEYAYSLSLSLAILFLGLYARGLRTGRFRGWTAIVLAVCILSHVVCGGFALVGAAVLTVMELVPVRWRLHDDGLGNRPGAARAPGRVGVQTAPRALAWGASTVGIGLALSAWWWVPFLADQAYATTMGYTNVTTYWALLYPVADHWAVVLAAIGAVCALVVRSRFGILVTVLGALAGLGVVFDPQGSLYNVRLQPLWFVCVDLLVGWLFALCAHAAARAWRRGRARWWLWRLERLPAGGRAPGPRPGAWALPAGSVGGPLVATVLALAVVVTPFVASPAVLADLHIHPGANQVSGWATYNYEGYEHQVGTAEYYGLMATMRRVGAEDGCGRAMWEYEPNQDRFGTPEALMLLAYWTDNCIDSQEGLLFESSATTPYHFLVQQELSESPSEAVVGLDYGDAPDIPEGISHLQLLGVRYFMASSPQIQEAAAADPALKLVATSGPYHESYNGSPLDLEWDVYEIAASPLVQPLGAEPAVLTHVAPAQTSWLPVSEHWFLDDWPSGVFLAAGGPASWPRDDHPMATPPRVKVRPTTVSDVTEGFDTVGFHVTRTGTPVLVKVSYFPNWHATGAEGPWRVTPNLMVVVPTSHEVTLTYGATPADRVGQVLSALGVVAVVVPGALATRAWWRRRRGARRGSVAA